MTPPPHVAKAHCYAIDVTQGRVPACKWVRLACARHLRDLERTDPGWPYRFDAAKAERVCVFGEMLPHIKGAWARRDAKTKLPQTIKLEPWQCFVLCMLFGWVKKANGMRRFRKASIYIPRKNGKSTLAAIIGWWMFAKDNEPGAEVFSGATSEKQAWEVFGPARQMAVALPDLPAQLGVTVNARSLLRIADNCKFEPVIGKPGDGASPHCAIVDEYHEHPDSTLHDTMQTGMGARQQPLLLIISTSGENLSGPCRDDWNDCGKLLDGVIEDETHFAIIWTIDEGDDWACEDALRKANPNFDVSVSRDFLLAQLAVAKRDAAKQGIFKIKHLNCWVSAAKGWLNMESWRKCGDSKLKLEDFAGQECFVALDGSAKIDIMSMVAAFKTGAGWTVFAKHYLPDETIQRTENAHYRGWVAKGWLTSAGEARIDFAAVEDDLKAWSEKFIIQQFAFDPRELHYFVAQVQAWAGFPCIEIPQSPAFMSEPMKEVEAQIAAGTLRHCNDPVLTWMASNVIKKEARGGGPVKYYHATKLRYENKIDGIVALIMALGRGMAEPVGGGGFSF